MEISSDAQISFTLMKCIAHLISEESTPKEEGRIRLTQRCTTQSGLTKSTSTNRPLKKDIITLFEEHTRDIWRKV
jgi:hypothetical protein